MPGGQLHQLDITCEPVISGSDVNVTVDGGILTLCEVRIFGKSTCSYMYI